MKKMRNDAMLELTDRFYSGSELLLEIKNSMVAGMSKGEIVCIMGKYYVLEGVVNYPELGIVDYNLVFLGETIHNIS